MTFLPKDYEQPKSEGNYFKLEQGENRFRILSSAIVGWEYWNTDGKPVRAKELWAEEPSDMREGERVKHFWAFVVWNYAVKKAQIMQITQKTIMGAIGAYVDNSKWGDPKGYDLVIKRSGEGLDTEYTVLAEPHSPAPKVDISNINLPALYEGADPFSQRNSEDVKAEDIPF